MTVTDPNAPAPADPNAPAPAPADPNAPAPVDPNAPAPAPAPPADADADDVTAPAASSTTPETAPKLSAGQLVSYTWDDPVDGPEQVRYGFVVAEPEPDAEAQTYTIAWLPPGHAQMPAGDLSAV